MTTKVVGILALGQLGALLAYGQAGTAAKPLMAEDVFKNVQVLKGIPVNEFMETMGFFSAALAYNCTSCHVEESLSSWSKFADDIPAKRMARTMVQMVNSINKANFGGQPVVTCFTCHRGAPDPKPIPSLTQQYSEPVDDPNEVEIIAQRKPDVTPDQVLDKYIAAIGGAKPLAALTSYVGKGIYQGYFEGKAPVEIFARPGRLTSIIHGKLGDRTTTFDGRSGWFAGSDRPVPVMALPPSEDLDALKLDADLSIPVNLKQALTDWRTGFPPVTIDDRDMVVVQGMTAKKSRVKLYFDSESGLLTRQVRFTKTLVGIVPTQVDYSDYRPVGGVKIPFKSTVTWTDGKATLELSEIQPNAAIADTRFAQPAPPAAPAPAPAPAKR